VPPALLDRYMQLGHSGFVLWYRAQNQGQDPSFEVLEGLARASERAKLSTGARIVKALVDAVT
jgi:hypothetical protein